MSLHPAHTHAFMLTFTNRVVTFILLTLALYIFVAAALLALNKTGLCFNSVGTLLLHWLSPVSIISLCLLFIGAIADALLTNLLAAPETQKSDFCTLIQNADATRLLLVLHTMIDGKGGRDVALVLGAALWKYHYLTRIPTESQFMTEFPTVTTKWRAIRNQISTPLPNGQDAFSQSIQNIEINL